MELRVSPELLCDWDAQGRSCDVGTLLVRVRWNPARYGGVKSRRHLLSVSCQGTGGLIEKPGWLLLSWQEVALKLLLSQLHLPPSELPSLVRVCFVLSRPLAFLKVLSLEEVLHAPSLREQNYWVRSIQPTSNPCSPGSARVWRCLEWPASVSEEEWIIYLWPKARPGKCISSWVSLLSEQLTCAGCAVAPGDCSQGAFLGGKHPGERHRRCSWWPFSKELEGSMLIILWDRCLKDGVDIGATLLYPT